jgi:hypothetical protein
MIPGAIQNSNCLLKAPESMPECAPLHVRMTDMGMTSAWFPSPDELKALTHGAPVYLTVYGCAHPPVSLSVGNVD